MDRLKRLLLPPPPHDLAGDDVRRGGHVPSLERRIRRMGDAASSLFRVSSLADFQGTPIERGLTLTAPGKGTLIGELRKSAAAVRCLLLPSRSRRHERRSELQAGPPGYVLETYI